MDILPLVLVKHNVSEADSAAVVRWQYESYPDMSITKSESSAIKVTFI
jgi:hypothetical protein